MESREFCRKRWECWLTILFVAAWLILAFWEFRSRSAGEAVAPLLFAVLLGTLGLWELITPYVRMTQEEIILRPDYRTRQTVAWADVVEFGQLGKKGNVWCLRLREASDVKVELRKVATWDRESLMSEIRLHVASYSHGEQTDEP